MRKISAARRSWLILLGVFLLMWALNSLCYRFYGDDYLYSFVWEGHAMSVPCQNMPGVFRALAIFSIP